MLERILEYEKEIANAGVIVVRGLNKSADPRDEQLYSDVICTSFHKSS